MKVILIGFCWMIKNRHDDKKRNSVSLFGERIRDVVLEIGENI